MQGAKVLAASAAAVFVFSTVSFADPRPGSARSRGFEIRLGGFFPSGDGEVWTTNEEVFTLEASDFNDVVLGFTYLHAFNNYLELGLNADFYDASALSAYRDFVDEDGFSIFHDTELRAMPVTADVRVLPFGRYRVRGPHGRRVLKPVLYVGAGLGANYWEYEELGDFLDFAEDPPVVFSDRFKDTGVAFEAHALAGVELPISPALNLLFEGRYSVSDDELGGDFAGLGKLELGGPSVYGGLAFRF